MNKLKTHLLPTTSAFCWLLLSSASALSFLGSQKAVSNSVALHHRKGNSNKKIDPSSYTPHLRAKIAHGVAKGERRANERKAPLRHVCHQCARPPALCVCNCLPKQQLSTRTQILILQHPNERRKRNFSTVPLLKLVLERVQIMAGYTFQAEQLAPVAEELAQGRKPLLLYPSPNAISLDNHHSNNVDSEAVESTSPSPTENLSKPFSKQHRNLLILIDGTWTEAKRMVRDSPSLVHRCQCVQFTSHSSSIYDAVRKEPGPHCLSTLEACSKALELLEPTPNTVLATQHLHQVLQAHVNLHLVNAHVNAPRSAGKTQQKLYAKSKRRREIELSMFEPSTTPLKETPVSPQRLPDGALLRPLQVSDAPLIDSWWDYQSAKSLPLIRRRIELDQGLACWGIEIQHNSTTTTTTATTANKELVACIVRYEGGTLGMLHCTPDYRRRGYGSILLKHATRALQDRNEERVAFIVDGNHASETLFQSVGWERENPNIKRGTGKRRAKRKWIHR